MEENEALMGSIVVSYARSVERGSGTMWMGHHNISITSKCYVPPNTIFTIFKNSEPLVMLHNPTKEAVEVGRTTVVEEDGNYWTL